MAFYNQRGKAEQYIKEGKYAIRWTRLSCRRFRDNADRLQLHALAYNLGNFMRTLALPNEGRSPKSGHRMAAEGMEFPWWMTSGTISTNLDVIWEMSDEGV